MLRLAPLVPLSVISDVDRGAIANNHINRLLYLPDQHFPDNVVDLGALNCFSKELIESGLKCGKLKKLASLNTLGYYVFLIKLTVHFMRPEDTGVQVDRREQYDSAQLVN